jgi:hypothetical protein
MWVTWDMERTHRPFVRPAGQSGRTARFESLRAASAVVDSSRAPAGTAPPRAPPVPVASFAPAQPHPRAQR